MTIKAVTTDGVAGRGKLQAGDEVVAVGDEPVEDARELLAEFRSAVSDQEFVPVFVNRSGRRVELRLRP